MTILGPIEATLVLAGALALLAAAAYAYVGYPLAVRLFVRPRPLALPDSERVPDKELPTISVLVAAYNEAAVIGARIENLLAQDYPAEKLEIFVVSDASDDGTDEIVRRVADGRVRLVRQDPRSGKTAGINRLGRLASGEVLVHTDANVVFAPGCLRALAAPFLREEVGLAIGRIAFTNEDEPEVAGGEGLYWRFETWTKHAEAERGLLCVANGGAYAIRRALWRELPADVAGDAAEPLVVAKSGARGVIAEGALAFERAAASLGEEYARKVRIIAQQVACARAIGLGGLPARVAWSYVSHKLLRYLVPLMAFGALVLSLAAAALGASAGLVLAAAVVAPLLFAPLGLLGLPGLPGRLAHVLLYLAMINLASLHGLWRGLAGRAQPSWEAARSTRGLPGRAPL